jgi:DNA-binding LytR/AlgR family response regulator
MPPWECLIIEDEPLAAEVLEDYVRAVPFLHLRGVCPDALFALEFLQTHPVDLLFLDIHLPRLKGLDFLKVLQHPPQVILTTAYHEYALQGYEFNVVDYLLKPIEFGRFLQAVHKLEPHRPRPGGQEQAPIASEPRFHFFNVDKKRVKVLEDDILYIESLKEYVRVVTASQALVTKFQLGQIEEQLATGQFLRIHRSFLVARGKITAYTATHVEVMGRELPIGRNYKEMVMRVLES